MIDPPGLEVLEKIGGGNLSLGVRVWFSQRLMWLRERPTRSATWAKVTPAPSRASRRRAAAARRSLSVLM